MRQFLNEPQVWSKRRGRRTHRLVTSADAVLEMNRSFKPHEHKKSYDSKYVGEALDDKYARTVVLTAQRRAGGLSCPTLAPTLIPQPSRSRHTCPAMPLFGNTTATALDCL